MVNAWTANRFSPLHARHLITGPNSSPPSAQLITCYAVTSPHAADASLVRAHIRRLFAAARATVSVEAASLPVLMRRLKKARRKVFEIRGLERCACLRSFFFFFLAGCV